MCYSERSGRGGLGAAGQQQGGRAGRVADAQPQLVLRMEAGVAAPGRSRSSYSEVANKAMDFLGVYGRVPDLHMSESCVAYFCVLEVYSHGLTLFDLHLACLDKQNMERKCASAGARHNAEGSGRERRAD